MSFPASFCHGIERGEIKFPQCIIRCRQCGAYLEVHGKNGWQSEPERNLAFGCSAGQPQPKGRMMITRPLQRLKPSSLCGDHRPYIHKSWSRTGIASDFQARSGTRYQTRSTSDWSRRPYFSRLPGVLNTCGETGRDKARNVNPPMMAATSKTAAVTSATSRSMSFMSIPVLTFKAGGTRTRHSPRTQNPRF